jgi:hypothetical protein
VGTLPAQVTWQVAAETKRFIQNMIAVGGAGKREVVTTILKTVRDLVPPLLHLIVGVHSLHIQKRCCSAHVVTLHETKPAPISKAQDCTCCLGSHAAADMGKNKSATAELS